jgi:hypothetical protein
MAIEILTQNRIPDAHRSVVALTRERRAAFVYIVLCMIGMLPTFLDASPAWRAAGLGLWFPGAGFLAIGPLGALATLLTLALFAISVVCWFGAGMVIAPVFVWGLSLALAALTAPGKAWVAAPYLVGALTFAGVSWSRRRNAKRDAADLKTRAARNAFLPGAIEAFRRALVARPKADEREMTLKQVQLLRYALDRALQPIGEFNGFDKKDQFQTAATRYQINALSYALGLAQCHYTPSFHGYLSQAQRNLIEKYLDRRVWNYWVYESMWGHLNFTNFDPVGRDNVMLTGFFGIQVGLYISNTGDRRYMEPGSLTFRLNSKKAFAHKFQDLAESVLWNFDHSAFCLYPCEPNWIYPICNHYGMTAAVLLDRLCGQSRVRSILPHWLDMLDSELSDKKGTPVPLRSTLTGWMPPFPATDAMYVPFAHCFIPERAERLWVTARTEMEPLITASPQGPALRLPGAGVDFGSYRKGHAMNYAQFASAAREMGDEAFASACERSLEDVGGYAVIDGVGRYANASNLGNAYAIMMAMQGRNDFRSAVVDGPAASTLKGPILAEASYPEVLVARAYSNGDDLELVLWPGAASGPQRLVLERLKPGVNYAVSGGQVGHFVADANGRTNLTVDLSGRTCLKIAPV